MVGRVVTLGGGGGHSVLLKGFKLHATRFGQGRLKLRDLTAIVSTADDGGSTGMLIREFGIPAVGDLRMCLSALADFGALKDLVDYRFVSAGHLNGHSLGNLLLTGALIVQTDLSEALKTACTLLRTDGKVVPSTATPVRLCAQLDDDFVVRGEAALRERAHRTLRIQRMFFERPDVVAPEGESTVPIEPFSPTATPEALRAIRQAKVIVLAPGSLYTSIVPTLLIADLADAIRESRAAKIYVCNVANEQGETDGFSVGDYLDAIRDHGGFSPDYVIVNKMSRRSSTKVEDPVLLTSFTEAGGARYVGTTQIIEESLADSSGEKHRPLLLAETVLVAAETHRGQKRRARKS